MCSFPKHKNKKIHLNAWEAEESEFVASLVYILNPSFQK